jgi:hypothetical protein
MTNLTHNHFTLRRVLLRILVFAMIVAGSTPMF